MGVKQAAEVVLREAGTPMHYRVITQKAIEMEWLHSQGKTPEVLMEHGIGVHRTTPDLYEIDEEFAAGGESDNA